MRLRLYIDNSSMISNIKDRLPISTRRNPLTKARISRDPGSVTEKLSSLGSILLQGTQGTVAVVESAITSTRDPVNSTETAAVVSQAHHEDKHLKLLLTTYVILSSSIAIFKILSERLGTVILDSVNSSENNSNYIQSIDSSSKNILATTKNTLTRSRNNVTVSEAVILHTEDCRNASERMLQIFQDLSDSVKLDRQIVSGTESNTRTESIRLLKLFSLFPTPELPLIKFYKAFDFGKLPNLKIKSQIQDLSTLPDIMNKVFINEVKTGGYTCQFTFAKGVTENPMESDLYFRPYTVDPGRNPIFINYHGNGHIRRMSTKEYYLFGVAGEVYKDQGCNNLIKTKADVRLQIAILSIEKQDSNGNRVSYNRLARRSSVGTYSINSITVCDGKKRIRYISTGYFGSSHDMRALSESRLGPNPEGSFSGDQYVLGDGGYKAYNYLAIEKFNTYIAIMRIEIEHAFGILKNIPLRIRSDQDIAFASGRI
ncbi:hypothetical protein INT48_002989 [Thamnidium elegans]|uniref:DDE Tnp4 domain-containing protein n=1 Tax=Thamnidium elegans TaxID=101142 RepID=A0A8H7SNI2_9FUNG|nr:hypothetical protein INT48_002989 [Thamnidium elegans]